MQFPHVFDGLLVSKSWRTNYYWHKKTLWVSQREPYRFPGISSSGFFTSFLIGGISISTLIYHFTTTKNFNRIPHVLTYIAIWIMFKLYRNIIPFLIPAHLIEWDPPVRYMYIFISSCIWRLSVFFLCVLVSCSSIFTFGFRFK